MYGLFAVEEILGRRLAEEEYSPLAPPSLRARQAEALTSGTNP